MWWKDLGLNLEGHDQLLAVLGLTKTSIGRTKIEMEGANGAANIARNQSTSC